MSTASKVAARKLEHPELYCPSPRCLWRTGGGYCPRHAESTEVESKYWPDDTNDFNGGNRNG
jgi:hypothetical protein